MQFLEKFKKSLSSMAEPVVEVSESGTNHLSVSDAVHFKPTDASEELKHKDIFTKTLHETSLRKNSIVHFIADAMNTDRAKDTDAEVKRLFEIKRRREFHRARLQISRKLCLQQAKSRANAI